MTRKVEHLDQAIHHTQQAAETTPRWHNDRMGFLAALDFFFVERFNHTGSMRDHVHALTYTEQGIGTARRIDPGTADYQNELLTNSEDRYRLKSSVNVKSVEGELVATPSNDPYRTASLNKLSTFFGDRHSQTGCMEDLQQAITYAKDALSATPGDHPKRAGHLYTLGLCFADKYRLTGDEDDDERSVQLFKDGVN